MLPNKLVYGLHPVAELIKKEYKFKKAYIQKNLETPFQENLIRYCKAKKINFYFVEKKELNQLTQQANHQGFVLECKTDFQKIVDLDNFLEKIAGNKNAFVTILDQITDQHNVGAIVRTAHFFGCSLIIMEKRKSAPINDVVHKVSAGASLIIPFYICEKITQVITSLRKYHYHIWATEINSENSLTSFNQKSFAPIKQAVIFGSEGEGVRPHIVRAVDSTIAIPTNSTAGNNFNSLNVSVAAGIVLYQLTKRGVG